MAEEQTTNPEETNQETPVVETTTNEAQANPEQFLKDFNWHNYEEGIGPVAVEQCGTKHCGDGGQRRVVRRSH